MKIGVATIWEPWKPGNDVCIREQIFDELWEEELDERGTEF